MTIEESPQIIPGGQLHAEGVEKLKKRMQEITVGLKLLEMEMIPITISRGKHTDIHLRT